MKFNKYKINFILEVIEFAEKNSVSATSKKFKLPICTIYRWKKDKLLIYELKNKKKKQEFEEKAAYKKLKVTYKTFGAAKYKSELRVRAVKYYKVHGRKKTMDKFKISESSIYTWVKKYDAGTLNKPRIVKRSINKTNRRAIEVSNKKELMKRIEYLLASHEFKMIKNMSVQSRYLIILGNNKKNISVQFLCNFLSVSKSGYYRWLSQGNKKGYKENDVLVKAIYEIREKYGDTYGIRRIQRILLKKYSIIESQYMINKHLKYLGLNTRFHSKKVNNGWKHLKEYNGELKNLLWDNVKQKPNYNFDYINDAWCSDITYIRKPGKIDRDKAIKLIAIMEIKTRRIIGWKIIKKENSGKTFRNLYKQTILKHGSPKIFHSDRGPEFTSNETLKISKSNKILQSFSRPYTPTDNALIERFFGTMKMENNNFKMCTNDAEIIHTVNKWINFYNNERYHSALDSSPKDKAKIIRENNFSELFEFTSNSLNYINKKIK